MAFFDKLGDFAGGFVQGAAQSMPAYMETKRREERRDVELEEDRRRQDRNFMYNTALQNKSPAAVQQLFEYDNEFGTLAAKSLASNKVNLANELRMDMDTRFNLVNTLMLNNPSFQTEEEVRTGQHEITKVGSALERYAQTIKDLQQYGEIVGVDFVGTLGDSPYERESVDEMTNLLSQRGREVATSNYREQQSEDLIKLGLQMLDPEMISKGWNMMALITEGGQKFRGQPVPYGLHSETVIKEGIDRGTLFVRNQNLMDLASRSPHMAAERAYESAKLNKPYPKHITEQIDSMVQMVESGDTESWLDKLMGDNQYEAALELVIDTERLPPLLLNKQGDWITRILKADDSHKQGLYDAGLDQFERDVAAEYKQSPDQQAAALNVQFHEYKGRTFSMRDAKIKTLLNYKNSSSKTKRGIAARIAAGAMSASHHGNIPQAFANKVIFDVREIERELGINPDEAQIDPTINVADPATGKTPEQVVTEEIESWQDKVRAIEGITLDEKTEILHILEATYNAKYGIKAGFAMRVIEDESERQAITLETALGPRTIGDYLRTDLPYHSSSRQRVQLAEFLDEESRYIVAHHDDVSKDKNKYELKIQTQLLHGAKAGILPYNVDIKAITKALMDVMKTKTAITAKPAFKEEVTEQPIDLFVDDPQAQVRVAEDGRDKESRKGAENILWRQQELERAKTKGLPAQERYLEERTEKYKEEYIDKGEHSLKEEEYLEDLRKNIIRTKERINELEGALRLPITPFQGIEAGAPGLASNIGAVLGNVQDQARGNKKKSEGLDVAEPNEVEQNLTVLDEVEPEVEPEAEIEQFLDIPLTEKAAGVTERFLPFITESAEANDVPADIIRKIIFVESSGIPDAFVRGSGAIGLMQITEIAAKDLGIPYDRKQLSDPKYNIEQGTRFLKMQYERMIFAYPNLSEEELWRKTATSFHSGFKNVQEDTLGPRGQAYAPKVFDMSKKFTGEPEVVDLF